MATSTPHTDLAPGSWPERLSPSAWHPYLRLMRLDRPTGIWLLLFPCWWAIALAAAPGGWPDPVLMVLFALGAVIMRGAGCTINDILDRDLDAQVERTRGRPIPSGQIGVGRASALLAGLLTAGLAILLLLNPLTILIGCLVVVPALLYPLAKRVTDYPQLVLALVYNTGALMGWTAARGTLDAPAWLLYAGGLAWTFGYDTIYAHQDRRDDAVVGVRSAAVRLGAASRDAVFIAYVLASAAWLAAGLAAGLGLWFLVGIAVVAVHLGWQVLGWNPDDPRDCLERFKANRTTGWALLAALVAGSLCQVPLT